jgi:hypothetical protein
MTEFSFKNKGKAFISLTAVVLLSSLFLLRCGQAPQDKTQSSLVDKQSTITTTDLNRRLFFKSSHDQIKFGYAVQSCFVKLGGNFLVDGYNSFCGEYNQNQNISPGSVAYVNDIKINGRNVRITGQVVQVQTCEVDVSQIIDKARQNNNNSVIPSQFIRDVKLKLENNDRLTLPSGVYYFKEIKVSGRAVLEFLGPATVVVEGDVSVEGQGQIKINPVFLRIISTGKVKVEGQGSIYAGIVGNEVKLGGKGQIFGGVISREFKGEGQGAVHFDKGLGLDRIEVFPSEVTIKVGETVQLTAVAKDIFGNEISCIGFEWSSSDQSVAVVDQNGLVQGVGEGRAIVSATAKKEGHILSFAREVVVNVIRSDSRFCPYNYNITNYIPPFLYFQALPTGAPMSVTFFVEAYDPDGGNLVIGMFDADGDGNWEIQQSLEIPYISGSFEWIYNSTGIFTAKIQVIDDEGQISTKSIPLFIQERCFLKLLWRDSDGDGYGNPNIPAISCHQIYGYVENNLDCDDQNMKVNPSSEEICNGIDDNCNGNIDEGVETPLSIIFGGQKEDGFDFIISIGNGEYMAGGRGGTSEQRDAFVMKINESGQIIWSKFIDSYISGLSGSERFGSGIVDIDGNIVLAGEVEHFIIGRKAFVVKMNREGEIIWSKIIAGSDDNIVGGGEVRTTPIVQDFDGNYIIAGTIQKRYGDKDMYIAKLNRSGEVQWFRTIGGIYDDFANSVKVDSAGNYIVVGKTNGFGFGMDDIFAVKLNSNGEIIWAKAIGGSSSDFAADVLVKGNSYIIAGGTESFGIGRYDIYLLKLNESGDIIWSNAMGGPENEFALHSILDKYGNVIAVGWIESVGPDDAFVLEISDSGMLNWAKYIGAGVVDGLTGITQKDDGKFFMAGGSYFRQYSGLGYYEVDFYLSEFDPHSGCACKVIDISRYLCESSGGYSVDVNPIVQSIYQLSYDVAITSLDVTFDLFHLCQ